jgi:fatty acid desaturase
VVSEYTKNGWIVTIAYLAVIYVLAEVFASQGEELDLIFSLLIGFAVVVTTLVLFFVSLRHAPKPKWQWGENKVKK